MTIPINLSYKEPASHCKKFELDLELLPTLNERTCSIFNALAPTTDALLISERLKEGFYRNPASFPARVKTLSILQDRLKNYSKYDECKDIFGSALFLGIFKITLIAAIIIGYIYNPIIFGALLGILILSNIIAYAISCSLDEMDGRQLDHEHIPYMDKGDFFIMILGGIPKLIYSLISRKDFLKKKCPEMETEITQAIEYFWSNYKPLKEELEKKLKALDEIELPVNLDQAINLKPAAKNIQSAKQEVEEALQDLEKGYKFAELLNQAFEKER